MTSALAAAVLLAPTVAAAQTRDRANPSCPTDPKWSNYQEMRFTVQDLDGRQILLAEGQIDDNLLPRLQTALETFDGEEIWLRSPGGNARVGNQAGLMIRQAGLSTRIPTDWACYGACNFMFMGGIDRSVNAGGLFIARTNPPFVYAGLDPAERRTHADEIAAGSALTASAQVDFLIRMGISRTLLSDIMYARPRDGSTRRCLTQAELRRYRVVSEVVRPSQDASRQAVKAD